MIESTVCCMLWRYKLFVLIGASLLFTIHILLAYKILNEENPVTTPKEHILHQQTESQSQILYSANGADDISSNLPTQRRRSISSQLSANSLYSSSSLFSSLDNKKYIVESSNGHNLTHKILNIEQLGFKPNCMINSKEAVSALQRAKSLDCRQYIAHVVCNANEIYPKNLPNHCPTGNHTPYNQLGCYRDNKDSRLLSDYFTTFKTTNEPKNCIQICLQYGYPYAGVQYGIECFCGTKKPTDSAKLPKTECNLKCPGNMNEICGGFFNMNIYETAIKPQTNEIIVQSDNSKRVKIVFLLTLNGRALRQVYRLIKALYAPQHIYYIHIDKRQDYLYRELLKLEAKFSNIKLARTRFSTIWGGASLLTMLLQCMEDLLSPIITEQWWDYVINLSESDYPVKKLEQLEDFLSDNRDKNFVKSHGRETQRFIQKQGLDKTFVECDWHMWRTGDRKLPTGIQIDGGSDWVTLSRSFVQYIIENKRSDDLIKGLLKIFQYTLLPAESFFHTVLRNSKFCHTYVDNNLHVTNWKRKLGCKCQYKHVVDWCGCSPNDFKPEDWPRIESTQEKKLYFGRKFEPIVNQHILTKLDEWLYGPYPKDYVNLHSYWQSFYHWQDSQNKDDDLYLTIAESVARRLLRQWQQVFQIKKILELTHYYHTDQYKGYLIKFEVCNVQTNETYELETRVRPIQYNKIAKNSKFAKRFRDFEISTDYDQKEQISRNFGKFLGPFSDLVLKFTFAGTLVNKGTSQHSYNLTLLWIDPYDRLQDFCELHIEDSKVDNINYTKAILKQPLIPGIWTVKLLGLTETYIQSKFLITPLAKYDREEIKLEKANIVNGGSSILTLPKDFIIPHEWLKHLNSMEIEKTENTIAQQSLRIGAKLHQWIDELVGKFHHLRDICAVNDTGIAALTTATIKRLPLCNQTTWSSLTSDPKSDMNLLIR